VGSTGGNARKQAGDQRPATPADEKPDHLPAAPEFIQGQLPTSRP